MTERLSGLAATFYCDHGHHLIQHTAKRLRTGNDDPTAVARQTFQFVRDRILFGFDRFQRKASETLKKGYGVCWNKALLLTALLRANGIPTQFASIPVKRSFIKPAIGGWHRLANHPYHHCLVRAEIAGRWTLIDPVLDLKTFAAFFLPLNPAWNIEWNGWDDMRLYTDSVTGPVRIHEDIDAALDGKVGNTELPAFLAWIGNSYVNSRMWKRAGARPDPPQWQEIGQRPR